MSDKREKSTEPTHTENVSVESLDEKNPEFREPPDGGRAWLVLVGCFCVRKNF